MPKKEYPRFLDAQNDLGTIHPISHIKNQIISFLEGEGFIHVVGPEIETEEYNFDMLNIKESHPARQMHDTFYVDEKAVF